MNNIEKIEMAKKIISDLNTELCMMTLTQESEARDKKIFSLKTQIKYIELGLKELETSYLLKNKDTGLYVCHDEEGYERETSKICFAMRFLPTAVNTYPNTELIVINEDELNTL